MIALSSNNLPAIVSNVGGALEKVVSDIELYTDERHPLDRRGQIALARIIEARPQLNNEPNVSLLVDALSWHGVNQSAEFAKIADEHDIRVVHLALDYLYEIGHRSRGGESSDEEKKYQSMTYVRQVSELITRLQDMGYIVDDVETLANVVYHLGGIELALKADDDDLEAIPFLRNL